MASTNPIGGGGSGLLSGLIQLKSRRLQSQTSQRLDSSSRSNSSRSASRSPSPKRRARAKLHSPISSGLLINKSMSPASPNKEYVRVLAYFFTV